MLAVAAALLAAAAPVPKGADEPRRIEKLFGTPVDPDGDTTFRLAGDKLTVRLSDQLHDFSNELVNRRNAPRTAREVGGDFAARVKVACKLPGETVLRRGLRAEYAAGLVAWAGETHGVRLDVARVLYDPTDAGAARHPNRITARGWAPGRGAGMLMPGDKFDPTVPVWLRLTRRGTGFEFAHSHDGTRWHQAGAFGEMAPAGPLKVGVIASHTTAAGFEATFEGFVIEPPAAK
jgi:hypothetical protein